MDILGSLSFIHVRGGSSDSKSHEHEPFESESLSKLSNKSGKKRKKTRIKDHSLNVQTKKSTNDIDDDDITNKEISKRQKKKPITSSDQNVSTKESSSNTSLSSVSNAKHSECLRRIKREWKEAVQLGIGYNWITMETVYNKKKRRKKSSKTHDYVRIGPMGKNLLRWHFSVLGPSNSIYEQGIYHGRVLLPKNYPGSPPRVQVLTPSGRFITGEDICLSASSYHPELWTPRWTIMSLIDALRLHMLTTANEIGGMNSSVETKERLARNSRVWRYGNVDHARMVQDGLFGVSSSSEDKEEEKSQEAIRPTEVDVTVLTSTNMQQETEQPLQKRPQLVVILLKVIVEFLGDPVRLVVLIFLSSALYLNCFPKPN